MGKRHHNLNGRAALAVLGRQEEIDPKRIGKLLPRQMARKQFGALVRESAPTIRRTVSDPPQSTFVEIMLRTAALESLKEGDFSTAAARTLELLAKTKLVQQITLDPA